MIFLTVGNQKPENGHLLFSLWEGQVEFGVSRIHALPIHLFLHRGLAFVPNVTICARWLSQLRGLRCSHNQIHSGEGFRTSSYPHVPLSSYHGGTFQKNIERWCIHNMLTQNTTPWHVEYFMWEGTFCILRGKEHPYLRKQRGTRKNLNG